MKCNTLYFVYQVGEKLGRYEVEKKKAVELEDYDLAMEKKVSETLFISACLIAGFN